MPGSAFTSACVRNGEVHIGKTYWDDDQRLTDLAGGPPPSWLSAEFSSLTVNLELSYISCVCVFATRQPPFTIFGHQGDFNFNPTFFVCVCVCVCVQFLFCFHISFCFFLTPTKCSSLRMGVVFISVQGFNHSV